MTADGKSIIVSHASTHELSVIDAEGLIAKLKGMPKTIEEAKAAGRYDTQGSYSSVTVEDVPNDLAYLVDLRRRIQLRRGGPWGTGQGRRPPGQRSARTGRDRHQDLHGRLLQRSDGRRGLGGQVLLSRES